MAFHDDDRISNESANPLFSDVLAQQLGRRHVLRGGLGAIALAMLGSPTSPLSARGAHAAGSALLAFARVPVSTADTVLVPEGYLAQVLYAWGDPVSDGPIFRPDASNSAREQARQAGVHHDGLHFFPLPLGSQSSTRGLLAINHEYTDDGLLHPGGT